MSVLFLEDKDFFFICKRYCVDINYFMSYFKDFKRMINVVKVLSLYWALLRVHSWSVQYFKQDLNNSITFLQ